MDVSRPVRTRIGGPSGTAVALALVVVASTVAPAIASGTAAERQTPRLDAHASHVSPGESIPDEAGSDREHPRDRRGNVAIDRQERPGGEGSGNASRFEIVEVTPDVAVGESGNLTVAIENVGPDAVHDATVTVGQLDPGVRVGVGGQRATTYVGTWDAGEVVAVTVEATVPPEARRRRYAVEVAVAYRTGANDSRRTANLVTGFTPSPEIDLELVSEPSSLRVGRTGTLRGEFENDGPRSIDDAVLVLVGAGNDSELVQPIDNEYYLADVDPREDREFEFDVEVAPGARPGRRQFTFRVEYRDEDGRVQRTRPLVEDWIVRERRDRFELDGVETTLRVDDDGRVTGRIRNREDEPVRDAVLRLVDPGTNATGSLTATDAEYAIGDLEPDETANFSFEVEASSSAVAGPRQLTFRVQYVDDDGATRRSEPLYTRIEIAEERDVFALRPVESSIEAGSTGVVRIEVTSVGDEPVTDVTAKLFVDEPLTGENDEAFVPALEPGESAMLAFRVSVAGDALPKVYPLSIDFEYEELDGDVKLSDTYRVALTVTRRERDGFPGLPFALDGVLPFVLGGVVLVAILALVAGVRR